MNIRNVYSAMTAEDQRSADTLAREIALESARSFIIDAPAGAGKTELLTQRFLMLLSHVNEPEEIVALTFTNKAAAEMRNRIMQSLYSAMDTLPVGAPSHKATTYRLARNVLIRNENRDWKLLEQPVRLRVMTLDALSARIARQMPLLSRFGTQPAVADDPQIYYEMAAKNTLDQLEDGTPQSETIARALAYFDNDVNRLQNMLISMLARRDQWSGHAFNSKPESLKDDVSRALRETVQSCLNDIATRISSARQATFMASARHAAAQSPNSPIHILANWNKPLTSELSSLPQWRAIATLFLTGDDELRKTFRAPINLAKTLHPENEAHKQILLETIADFLASGDTLTLASIRKLPDPELSIDEAQTINNLSELLRLAYTQLWLVFSEAKAVDFGEIATRACNALGDIENCGDIDDRMDYRIKHLLVDEFQDTSPLQVDLIEKLTANWAGDLDRSLFLVGDPMQSIYRFRKADVGLFLRVREHGIGHLHPESLRLYLNNRSNSNIIDWVNETFCDIFASEDNAILGAVTYAPSVPNRPAINNAGVFIHPIITGDTLTDTGEVTTKSQADEQEATCIVQLIREARKSNPEGTVAILVRARSHLNALVSQLQTIEPSISFQAVEIDALAERQIIQDLASLTRALHHRGDRVHWLSILRAPWCGLTLSDLHILASDDHQRTLWSLMHEEDRIERLSVDGQLRLLSLRQAIAEAYANQGLQRPRRWVEGVWHALGGPACLKTTSDIKDARAFFQLLDHLAEHGNLDLARLDDSLDKLFATPDSTPESTHVQLMTIHKSKGLEFDTVILPGLHKTPPSDEKSLLIWDNLLLDDGREHLIVAPAPPAGRKGENEERIPTTYELLRSLENTRAQNEGLRLLYVAATRAIRQLHLIGIANRNLRSERPDALKQPASASLLAPLWPALEKKFSEAAITQSAFSQTTQSINPATFVPKLIRIAKPQPLWKDTASETTQVQDETNPYQFSSSLDMDIGTLIHRYLEAFAKDGLEVWHETRISALKPHFARILSSQGHASKDVDSAIQIVHDTLQFAIIDEQSRWILGPHEAAACELPLSSMTIGTDSIEASRDIRRNVIDRTFIEDGVRWIIDYKTLQIKDHTDKLDALLTEKAQNYRPQLERYADLFKHEADQGLKIRIAIFFPTHGKLVTL